MDALEAYRESWTRAGSMCGVSFDASSVPAPADLLSMAREYRQWYDRAMGDTTSYTILSQVDALAPQQFTYALRQAGLFDEWSTLLDNWPQVPFMISWATMYGEASRIYNDEIRPNATLDDAQLAAEIDQAMAGAS
jgi:hypothetical protein